MAPPQSDAGPAQKEAGGWLTSVVDTALGGDPRKDGRQEPPGGGNLFKDINALRTPNEMNLASPDANDADALERARYTDTIFGQIAGSKAFEITTLSIISLNAVAIGYDTDYSARWGKPDNLYKGPYGFIFIENFFCVYFTGEVAIRFIAYKSKLACLWDAWFVFDASLVTMMVVETWILPLVSNGGPFAQLSILRLLRLLRITRMARLMRAVPEMMVIIKGMIAATRTVLCTGVLLLLVLYTFCILFTNEYHQGKVLDADVETNYEYMFGSMGKSMFTLFIMGTILDDVTQATNAIRESGNGWMLVSFIVFILISSFMMLNMLIGVLVEVVAATAECEDAKRIEANVREAIAQIFSSMDKDQNQEISCAEFLDMRNHKNVMDALADLDIQKQHFNLYAELFFKPEGDSEVPPSLSYEKLCTLIVRLRPGSFVSALDFASFSKAISKIHDRIKDRITQVERLAHQVGGLPPLEIEGQGTRALSEILTEKRQELNIMSPDKISGPTGEATPNGASRSDFNFLSESDRERLHGTEHQDIVQELQRRLGSAALEKCGVPLSVLEEAIPGCVPQQNPSDDGTVYV